MVDQQTQPQCLMLMSRLLYYCPISHWTVHKAVTLLCETSLSLFHQAIVDICLLSVSANPCQLPQRSMLSPGFPLPTPSPCESGLLCTHRCRGGSQHHWAVAGSFNANSERLFVWALFGGFAGAAKHNVFFVDALVYNTTPLTWHYLCLNISVCLQCPLVQNVWFNNSFGKFLM